MRICFADIRLAYSHASLALPLFERAVTAAGVPEVQWFRLAATTADRVTPAAVEVSRYNPDLLLATAYLFNRDWLLALAARVKALCQPCLVILGGPEFLGDNEHFLRHEPAITAVFRGEGEAALPPLLQVLARFVGNTRDATANPRLAPDLAITGLCWLDAAGNYHDGGRAALTEAEMAALPPATASPLFDWGKAFIQVETTRGCPYGCSFCTSCRSGKPRHFPVARVQAELAAAVSYGIGDIRILDRTFNVDADSATARLQLFLTQFPELRYHLELHPGLLPPELRTRLAAIPAGRLHIEVGLQTTHAAALAACGRGGDPARDWEGLAFLASCPNLELHVDLLAGLPLLGLEPVLADLRRLVTLGVAEIQLEIVKILPGTPLADQAAEWGIRFSPVPPYEVLRTPQISAAELLHLAGVSVLVDAFHNHPALRALVRLAVARNPAFFTDLLAAAKPAPGAAPGWSLEARFHLLWPFIAADAMAATLFARQWLDSGLSPAACPAGRGKPWSKPLPLDAVLVAGSAEVHLRQSRIWRLELPDGVWWFVYDRSRSPTRPVASYHADAGDVAGGESA